MLDQSLPDDGTARRMEFMSLLDMDGSTIGGLALLNKLKQNKIRTWDDDLFNSTSNALLDDKKIEKRQGQGGAYCRAIAFDPLAGDRKDEAIMYKPLTHILKQWAEDNAMSKHIIAETGRQGSRKTGGKLTRPDIICLAINTYEFVPGTYMELVTFEVEAYDNVNVKAVYEAQAHRRFATMAYVIFFVPENEKIPNFCDDCEKGLTAAKEAAYETGIGLIVVRDLSHDGRMRNKCWEELVNPVRYNPHPKLLNEFVKTQLEDCHKDIKELVNGVNSKP